MGTVGLMIGKHLKEEEEPKIIPIIPDGIIINILIRLPVKIVVRFTLVCKRWRNLTRNRRFVDLIFKNSIPNILGVFTMPYCKLGLLALENWWDSATSWEKAYELPMNTLNIGNDCPKSRVLFSHAGIIVLQESQVSDKTYILNPARPDSEYISISYSDQLGRSELYGVYYHPLLEVYCCLFEGRPRSGGLVFVDHVDFKILYFGSCPYLKTISNPFSKRVKMDNAVPLLINNFLYWKLECEDDEEDGRFDIMKFDILSEEFTVIPSPINTRCEYHQTHLLNCDGILCVLWMGSIKISIWRLENIADQLWTTTEYTLQMYEEVEVCHGDEEIDVLAVVDGMLAIQLDQILQVYNLMEGTVREYPKMRTRARISFLSHQMSLASLCNGKTTICIEPDDKVVVT